MAKSKTDSAIEPNEQVDDAEAVDVPSAALVTATASTRCPQSMPGCTGDRPYKGIYNGGHWYECDVCGSGMLGAAPPVI